MCVDLRYSYFNKKTEADIFWKWLNEGQNGKFVTPFQKQVVEPDKVYFETSDKRIETSNGSYPASYHVFKDNIDCHPDRYPCILLDIVAQDNIEAAGRVMYIFSHLSWEKYQNQLSSRPLDITENGVEVDADCALMEE